MEKMKGPWSEKMGRNQRSVVREKRHNESSGVREKLQKIKGPLSKRNGKISEICGQRIMEKINGPRLKKWKTI